jgi:hypothetical protein
MSAGLEPHPELEDMGRLAGWLLRRAVTAARAQGGAPVRRALLAHLGPDAPDGRWSPRRGPPMIT